MSWAWFWFICSAILLVDGVRSYNKTKKLESIASASLNAALATATYKRDPKKVSVMYIENLSHTLDGNIYQDQMNRLIAANGLSYRINDSQILSRYENVELLDPLVARVSQNVEQIGEVVGHLRYDYESSINDLED